MTHPELKTKAVSDVTHFSICLHSRARVRVRVRVHSKNPSQASQRHGCREATNMAEKQEARFRTLVEYVQELARQHNEVGDMRTARVERHRRRR